MNDEFDKEHIFREARNHCDAARFFIAVRVRTAVFVA